MLVLPQYEAAVPVAQIFIFTGIIQGLVNVTILGVVVAGRQGRLPLFTIGAVGINVGLSLLALQAGLGLVGVAVAALITRALYAAGVLALRAGSSLRQPIAPRVFEAVVKRLLPSIWCAVVVLVIDHLLYVREPAQTLPALLAYCVALLPLMPLMRRTLADFRRLS